MICYFVTNFDVIQSLASALGGLCSIIVTFFLYSGTLVGLCSMIMAFFCAHVPWEDCVL